MFRFCFCRRACKWLAYITLICLSGCSSGNWKASNYVITQRLFSPDSSRVVMTYHIDRGALGNGPTRSAIMVVPDTLDFNDRNTLPCFDLPLYACYYPDQWLNNKTLQVLLNERPFVKAGKKIDTASIIISGITCKVSAVDISHQLPPLIEYFSLSRDRKTILAVYRYNGDFNVSVFPYASPLPRIGNIYTNTAISFNPVQYVDWSDDDIDMFLHVSREADISYYSADDYLNKGITYAVHFRDAKVFTRQFPNAVFDHLPLYRDSLIEKELLQRGDTIQAVITSSLWAKEEENSVFNVEYRYVINGQPIRSYFQVARSINDGAGFQPGDSVSILYDPNQPLVHRPLGSYLR